MRIRPLPYLFGALMILAGCTSTTNAAGPNPSGRPSTLVEGSTGRSVSPTRSPTATTSPSPGTSSADCAILPLNNVWHADVSKLPVLKASATYVTSIGTGASVHADFGSGLWEGAPIGIPITTVPANQAKVSVSFQYRDESDAGPYPVPATAKIEGGTTSKGDRHVILYDPAHCLDWELYAAYPQADGSWRAGSGAIYNLRSNQLRHAGWTSADAAGLPILPGLVTWAEVESGHIDHAIRVTVPATQAAYIWPARHQASSSTDRTLPPMGLRLRLKASVDVSHLPYQARIVAIAMKRYGVIIADNGSPWYLSGAPDSHWNNDALHALGTLTGADFEAVDESHLMVSSSSAAYRLTHH